MRPQPSNIREARSRRGVTLVEMLVTLAILLIMMTAIVQIFQAATGSLSSLVAYQEMDSGLRRLDGILRSDLNGVTAKMTPPNNPKDNQGFFVYGENAFADLQGEDADDYAHFTTKAPAGRPFIGRYWPNGSTTPISITSQFAEVIYFLRNGNLYRRVFLVAPDLQKNIVQMKQNVDGAGKSFPPKILGGYEASWQGMNDLSARPSATGAGIILNTLGDLTNRENRAFSPRFANDFVGNDQTPDDFNSYNDGMNDVVVGDGVPDFYPTLYYSIFPGVSGPLRNAALIHEGGIPSARIGSSYSTMAFPYVFPGAYSHPDPYSRGQGWLHSPNPDIANSSNYLNYLQRLNHSPLELGDNLPRPVATSADNTNTVGGLQTSWIFPTWRETLSINWTDPTHQPNNSATGYSQPLGLAPRGTINGTTGTVNDDVNLLPPMASGLLPAAQAGAFATIRPTMQPFSDGLGSGSSFMDNPALYQASWEDDLLLSGVRSFDIKAYDNAAGDYFDLGWGDDARLPLGNTYYTLNGNAPPFMSANPSMAFNQTTKSYYFNFLQPDTANPGYYNYRTGTSRPLIFLNNNFVDLLNGTFAHEGRMPPLVADNRLDAQFPNPTYGPNYVSVYSGASQYSSNIGDDNPNIVRLRRVWDSWSTDYTMAPAKGFDPASKVPIGPPFSPPVYPSYPPPYPAPLRGIQIQIRVQDPTGRYVKSVTIRQDFTDKL